MTLRDIAIVVTVLCLSATCFADDCRYEFTVQGGLASLGKCSNMDHETGRKVNSMESQIAIAHERANAISETYGREIAKLENETKSLKDWTMDIHTTMVGIQASVSRVTKMEGEIEAVRELVISTNTSLVPKFSNLQEKVLDFVHNIQKETSSLAASYRSVLLKATEQDNILSQITASLNSLQTSLRTMEHLPETVDDVKNKFFDQQSNISSLLGDVGNMKTRLLTIGQQTDGLETAVSRNGDRLSHLEGEAHSRIEPMLTTMTSRLNGLDHVTANHSIELEFSRQTATSLNARLQNIETWHTSLGNTGSGSTSPMSELNELKETLRTLQAAVDSNKDQMQQMGNIFTKKFHGFDSKFEDLSRDVQRIDSEINK